MNLGDRRYVGIIGLVLAAFLIVLLPLTAMTSVSAPVAQPAPPDVTFGSPPPTEAPSCLSEQPVHYYTQDAGKVSPNAFGPSAVTDSPSSALLEMQHRLCGDETIGGDQALFTAIGSAVYGWDPNQELSNWGPGLEQFLGSIQWDTAKIIMDTPEYSEQTLEMVVRPGARPLVGAVTPEREPNTYLVFDVEFEGDVVSLELALDCGFQPRFMTPAELPAALRQ